QGRRENRRPQRAQASARLNEGQLIKPPNPFAHAEALIELEQVGATAEQNVLAVIDHFAGSGMLVGRRAAADVGTALEERDLSTSLSQGAAGSQTGQAAADNSDSISL